MNGLKQFINKWGFVLLPFFCYFLLFLEYENIIFVGKENIYYFFFLCFIILCVMRK
jgi:hypothetical protein